MLGQVASALTLLFSIVTEATPVPPSDYELIRSTLAKYPLSIDSKQFSDLSQVFSENAIGNYGPPLNTLSGLNDIEAVLEDRYVKHNPILLLKHISHLYRYHVTISTTSAISTI